MEHESALRGCVDLVSLNVCQHCSCTSVHILCTSANVVTSALGQVLSKTVIHGIESQHSFDFISLVILGGKAPPPKGGQGTTAQKGRGSTTPPRKVPLVVVFPDHHPEGERREGTII